MGRVCRPRSAWTHFVASRACTAPATPKKVLAAEWKTLPAQEKAVFQKMYERDCERYANDVRALSGAPRTAPSPARRSCAYTNFVRCERVRLRATGGGVDFSAGAKLIGERWRNLSPAERARYKVPVAVQEDGATASRVEVV